MFRKANTYLGVRKCNEECTLCKNNLHTGPSLTLKNGTVIRANEIFDCKSRNLLYIIQCGICFEHYNGETGDTITNRSTVHRQHARECCQNIFRKLKVDQHLRTCAKHKYKIFPYKRLRKNCTIYRRVVEAAHIKQYKPKLNCESSFNPLYTC